MNPLRDDAPNTLTVLDFRTLMVRRLASRSFPTADARTVAHAIVTILAIGIDPDGLRGRVRLSLPTLMAASRLSRDAAYAATAWLVDVGFLIELDDAMDQTYITYAIDVRALPLTGHDVRLEAA